MNTQISSKIVSFFQSLAQLQTETNQAARDILMGGLTNLNDVMDLFSTLLTNKGTDSIIYCDLLTCTLSTTTSSKSINLQWKTQPNAANIVIGNVNSTQVQVFYVNDTFSPKLYIESAGNDGQAVKVGGNTMNNNRNCMAQLAAPGAQPPGQNQQQNSQPAGQPANGQQGQPQQSPQNGTQPQQNGNQMPVQNNTQLRPQNGTQPQQNGTQPPQNGTQPPQNGSQQLPPQNGTQPQPNSTARPLRNLQNVGSAQTVNQGGQGGQGGNGCPTLQSSKCTTNFYNYCAKSGLFGNMSQIVCDSVLPTICDATKAPSINGANWKLTCGKWVVANFAKNDRFNPNNVLKLCTLVNSTNNMGRRELQASASSVTTIPSSSDPTLSDPVAQLNSTAIASTTTNVTVDGSSESTSVGATSDKFTSINSVSASISNSSSSSVINISGITLIMSIFFMI